ncbi:Odorant receptor [Operophtera brumata]|uniref:Odorant receptor n=1 Tax=Operophtera brumata TaxID=104452 RepID=A0A0L7L2U0_OPEBR|nr:Odorant receptor [Operophtera brumata]
MSKRLSTADHSIRYLVYSSVVKLLIAMIMSGEVWFVYSEYQNLELDDIAASINIDHRDVYRRLANSMESPHFDTSTDERKRLVKHWADTQERYLKMMLGLGNCTLAAW